MKKSNAKLLSLSFLIIITSLVFWPRSSSASSLAYDLRGKFILEVEAQGQAWYLDTINTLRHYLPNNYQALLKLRDLSIGMTDANLAKIPVAVDPRLVRIDSDGDGLDDRLELAVGSNPNKRDTDDDGFDDALELSQHFDIKDKGRAPIDLIFTKRFLGRIIIQVESHGELWYVNPDDGLRYFIGDSADLSNIIRYLAIGVSAQDINNIVDSSLIKTGAQKKLQVKLGKTQRLYYYLGDLELGSFPISAGKASTPTPTGSFKILNKYPKAWSSYGLWMPYWLGLGNGRFGFHELPIWPNGYREGANHLGIPVSHGCIRLGIGPAEFLYNWVDIATPVEIN